MKEPFFVEEAEGGDSFCEFLEKYLILFLLCNALKQSLRIRQLHKIINIFSKILNEIVKVEVWLMAYINLQERFVKLFDVVVIETQAFFDVCKILWVEGEFSLLFLFRWD